MAVPNGFIVAHPGTAAVVAGLAGWSRVTALDGRFVKMVATNATNPGTTGGATNHQHTFTAHGHSGFSHNHTGWATTGTVLGCRATICRNPNLGAVSHLGCGHTHTLTSTTATVAGSNNASPANYDAQTTEPPNLVVIFIKSDGTPSGIPNNAIAFFNGAAPTGWTTYANAANRLLKGAAAAGDGGGTGGTGDVHTHTSASHAHALPTHNHPVNTAAGSPSAGTGGAGAPNVMITTGHAHGMTSACGASGTSCGPSSTTSSAGDMTPPWYKLNPIQNTSGSNSFPVNVIGMWDGTIASIPSNLKICDGANGTPNVSNGQYVRGAANSGEVGNTGGTTNHSHTGSHTHVGGNSHAHATPSTGTSGGPQNCGFVSACAGSPSGAHKHGNTAANSTSVAHGTSCAACAAAPATTTEPLFTTVAYVQYQNAVPTAPTLTLPVAGTVYNGTVTISGTSTDPDGDQYQMEVDYSTDGAVWTNIGTSALTNSGVAATLSWNTDPRTRGTTYQVRARSKDPSGTNTFSGYTTTGLFTIDYLPATPVITSPVAATGYTGTITLAATVTDPDAGQTIGTNWEYSSDGGGSWVPIAGQGSFVATGGSSVLVWNVNGFTVGANYKVRVQAVDSIGVLSAAKATLAGVFSIAFGASTTSIFAANNTARFYATPNTAAFYAQKS